MSSELKSLKQRITELEAENSGLRIKLSVSDAEIAELKRRNAEFLRANKEYNERRDAENAELKAELAKLRHDFDSSNLTRPLQPQHVTNVQNSCSVGEEEISKIITIPQPDASDPVKDRPINGATSDNINIKSMEERETDTFLSEVYKKSVSNEIRRKYREKKLLRE